MPSNFESEGKLFYSQVLHVSGLLSIPDQLHHLFVCMSGIYTVSLKRWGKMFPGSPPHGTAYIWFRLEMNGLTVTYRASKIRSKFQKGKVKIWSVRSHSGIPEKKYFRKDPIFKLQNKIITFGKAPFPILNKKSLRDCWAKTQTWVTKTKKSYCWSSQYFAGVEIFTWCCFSPRAPHT